MDSRERVLLALDHEEPDRVPVDLWSSKGFDRKVEALLGLSKEDLLDLYDVDLRYIEGPRYVGPPLRRLPDGSEEDLWGVPRVRVAVGEGLERETYREVVSPPLASARTVEEIHSYLRWPSPDWFDYTPIKGQCEEVHRKGRAAVFMGDRLNRIAQLKPAMYLRGVEQIFVDMALSPEIAHTIFSHIRDFYLEYEGCILEAADGELDILLTGDDFGSQSGPLISPAMWEEFLGEGFRQYIALAHSYRVKVMHHTCGSVRPLIPLMLERGLDVLQSLQPEASDMDPWALKAEFEERLSFQGGISVQRTLPFGTPEEVKREVRDRIEALAPGGGYILGTAHNIQADVPLDNFKALLEAYREYGRY
ncbi:MAG TPA: hypothetical protein EYP17_08435 [Candidatus Latescibacteria bacterium]|nr:hypothetical protein [Candidatus Latescibacterota bacterium]